MKQKNIADIHCPNCGAAARFDIKKQMYLCAYCGGNVGINEAIEQKQGFRKLQQEKLNNSVASYHLKKATCPGCGAKVVFEENEALANCSFCGKALVRGNYLSAKDMPELIIPFRITDTEARDLLRQWCKKNKNKSEAKKILQQMEDLRGFYLPYELVKGPVNCTVKRIDGSRNYNCAGYIEDQYINCSKQLDNLLLDGMEPFEADDIEVFDFGYLAGQGVKTRDITDKDLLTRIEQELGERYKPEVQKTLETKAVNVTAHAEGILRMPVLLPVYYLKAGDVLSAVNGQTGKVCVRAEKESHYIFLPWWLKAILSTLLLSAITFGLSRLFGIEPTGSVILTGALGIFFLLVTLTAYSDTNKTELLVGAGRKIYQSKGGPLRRKEDGRLYKDDKPVKKEDMAPIFFEKIDGKVQPVVLRFTSPVRIFTYFVMALLVLFLPVIFALIINGFSFSRINLAGSAVWFCIFVPVIPIYLLKFGRIELYDRPWIYILTQDGKKKRYHKKPDFRLTPGLFIDILKALVIPPVSLAVWFAIISFIIMVYLTAGY